MATTDPRAALMGNAPTQGNLRAVRARAQELQKTIDEVIFGLRHNAGALKWDDIVRKYSVINAQLAGLREALRPGTLDGFALLPRVVPEAGFAEAVAVQLSSSLTPEGEAAAAAAAEAVDRALGLAAEMPAMQRFELLNSAVESHNMLVSALTHNVAGGGGMGGPGGGAAAGTATPGPLFPDGPLRKRQKELSEQTAQAIAAKARAAQAAAAALAAAARGPAAATASALAAAGARQAAAPTAGGRRPGAGGGPGEGPDPALVFLLTGAR